MSLETSNASRLQAQQRREMVLFKWKDDFRIGLDDIDAEHRIFMGYINQGYDAVTVNRQTGVPPDRDS